MRAILDLRHRPAAALIGLALATIALIALLFVITGTGTF